MLFVNGFILLIVFSIANSAQAQQYILEPQYNFQPSQDDFNKQFQFQQQFSRIPTANPYLTHQRDLQTSDLPFHLQKTLPQYRFATKEQQLQKINQPYRNDVIYTSNKRPAYDDVFQSVAPSTHRPNYSHFLSQNHNRNPSDTETFLGQITLDNTFANSNAFYPATPNVAKRRPIPDKLLRQHTRILAPDPNDKQNELQENKYFVDENGDVFSTTEFPPSRNVFGAKKLTTKLEIEPDFRRNNVVADQLYNSANNLETAPHHSNRNVFPDEQADPTVESPEEVEEEDVYEEPVVSVVTTKSVINNTVIATSPPSTTSSTTTLGTTTPTPTTSTTTAVVENATDSWVVVASVQTSKSISGAHYLPSSIVAQEERIALLNEKEQQQSEEITTETDYEFTETTEETTQTVVKHSTESLIDKLDRVQSDLSSGLLSGGYKNENNNIAVITENMTDKMHDIDMTEQPTVASQIFPSSTPDEHKIKTNPNLKPIGFSNKRKPLTYNKKLPTPLIPHKAPAREKSSDLVAELLKNYKNTISNDTDNKTELIPHRFGHKNETNTDVEKLLKLAKPVDIKNFLPPGYKAPETTTARNKLQAILSKTTLEDVSAFLPPGYKLTTEKTTTTAATTTTSTTTISAIDALFAKSKQEDISKFLPPGYKPDDNTETTTKRTTTTTIKSKPKVSDIFEKSVKDDISAFLPPGYKSRATTRKPSSIKPNIEVEKLPTSLLPSGYKPRKEMSKVESTTQSITTSSSTSKPSGGLKVVFPSRPGGNKRVIHKTTTAKPKEEKKEVTQVPLPTIHKGWPTRATTEFTGWPTPSTTPISIEKLLESVQKVSPTDAEPEYVTLSSTTQKTVTMTTTTPKPTTPGVCADDCDFVGTIRLVDGVKWMPELLDKNTKEWQLLANEVRTQLEEVYSKSDYLNEMFKNLRIDGFSEGSVLVDYLVEMKNANTEVSTIQMKKLFNEALRSASKPTREGKSLNETEDRGEKATFGRFIIDLEHTDFIVVPKQIVPMVGYAEDNILLPQWAIAVIVIGLASLLFVIIFGVTVLLNRSRNAKKKIPTPLTQEMLNELNKNHMMGYDSSALEDPYSIEAGFWDPRKMDAHKDYNKLPKKGSSGSIPDNSMTNLYDSWKSQWNSYYNTNGGGAGGYYGQSGPSSSYRLYERRRSYDTNF